MSIYKNEQIASRLARHTDPSSSHAAARHMVDSGKHGEQMTRVLELVRRYPNHTALELTEYTTLDRYQIQRRLSDLMDRGKIVRSAEPRKCNKGGRASHTWRPA